MAKVENFEDLEVWQLARVLASKIYELTRNGEFAKDFGLRDQIRRATVSIVSNIAEGFGRRSNVEFSRFLEIASGSTSEVQAHLYIAHDLKYLTKEQFDSVFVDVKQIGGRMLTKLMQYLRNASKPSDSSAEENNH